MLVRVGDVNRIDLVKYALLAHGYWRNKGLAADLVILNEDFSGYRAVLHDRDHGADQRRTGGAGRGQTGRGLRPPGRRAFRGRSGAVPDRRPRRPHRLHREAWPSRYNGGRRRSAFRLARSLRVTPRPRRSQPLADSRKHLPQRPGRLHRRRARVRHHSRTRAEHARALGRTSSRARTSGRS